MPAKFGLLFSNYILTIELALVKKKKSQLI